MKGLTLLCVPLILLCGNASAASKEDLYGTWRLVSDLRQDVVNGVRTDNWGGTPQGYLTYGRDGRMSAMVVGGKRPKPKDLARVSDDDRVALFKTMLAYGHLFRRGRDGDPSRRYFLERELDGDKSDTTCPD